MANLASRTALQPSKQFSTPDEQDAWLMGLMTTAEAMKPGSPVLEQVANDLMVDLYAEVVAEVGPQAFYSAWLQVIRSSKFRPDIADIRTAAGINPGICDPNEKAASLAITEIFEKMRQFKGALEPKQVMVHEDGNSYLRTVVCEPLDARSEAALLILGYGDRKRGLEALQPHPAVSEVEAQWRSKQAKDVESVWLEAWRRA